MPPNDRSEVSRPHGVERGERDVGEAFARHGLGLVGQRAEIAHGDVHVVVGIGGHAKTIGVAGGGEDLRPAGAAKRAVELDEERIPVTGALDGAVAEVRLAGERAGEVHVPVAIRGEALGAVRVGPAEQAAPQMVAVRIKLGHIDVVRAHSVELAAPKSIRPNARPMMMTLSSPSTWSLVAYWLLLSPKCLAHCGIPLASYLASTMSDFSPTDVSGPVPKSTVS